MFSKQYFFRTDDRIDSVYAKLILTDNNYCDFRVLYNIIIIIHRFKVILYITSFAQSLVSVLNFAVKCVYSIVPSSYVRVCANRSTLNVTHYKSINGNMIQCFINGSDIMFVYAGRYTNTYTHILCTIFTYYIL